ncbi:M1 family aminopeptidase [Alteromonas ponticola]|nr:M1 family aminopeptidase [Alteromonas sp. ASW11-130]
MFSQFQEMEARRVFPSLDDPSKKTSFTFTLNIPDSMEALHTTRPVSVVRKGTRKIVQFASTAKINTDVLALAVGNFNSQTLTETSLKSQIYSPVGLEVEVPESLGLLVKQSVSYMRDYLGTPFPYDKLDFLLTPLGTLAAMENVGLIALNTNQLPHADFSNYDTCNFRKLVAHEIAHMWFGNHITMAWYDDMWLNESFSEFFAAKIVHHYYPDNKSCTFAPQAEAFRDDSVSARPIKRVVKNRADNEGAGQLFYTKGRALLDMIEGHVGQALFRQKIREYVLAHSGDNVTTADFTDLFPPKYFVSDIVASFTEQSGYPLVLLLEEKGEFFFSQQSYHGEKNKRWVIPITLKVLAGKNISVHQLLLSKEIQPIEGIVLNQPLFIDGNGIGYFRWERKSDNPAFPLNNLTISERLASMNNNNALANSGRLNYKAYVDELIRVLNDLPFNSLEVVTALDVLNNSFIELVPAPLQKTYVDYIRSKLSLDVPWETLIRYDTGSQWLELYGVHFKSEEAIQFANDYFSQTPITELKSRVSVLRVLASNSTNEEYNSLLKLFNVDNLNVKEDVLDSLGYVANTQQLTRFYDFLLSNETKGFVIDYRFQFPIFQPKLREAAARYIQKHSLNIRERIPEDQLQWFPYNFLTSCSFSESKLVSDTFSEWSDVLGLNEKLEIVLEGIHTCQNNSRVTIKQLADF